MGQNDLTGLGEINALLGHGTEYEGKLTFAGRVRIDGVFRGDIFSDNVLIVGEGAEVRATIDVGTLIVRGGELWGEIRARQLVEIHAPGRVHGNIRTPQLFIERGVVFDGQCTMDDATESEVHELDGDPVPVRGASPDAEPAEAESAEAESAEAEPAEAESAEAEPAEAEPAEAESAEAESEKLANGPAELDA